MPYISRRFSRFLLVGGANTVVTYIIYLGFIEFMPYWGAFSIAFVAGILLSYVLNALLVFEVGLDRAGLTRFPLAYLFQYCAGLGLLWLQVKILGIPERIAPILNVIVLAPLTFFLVQLVLEKGGTRGGCGCKSERLPGDRAA